MMIFPRKYIFVRKFRLTCLEYFLLFSLGSFCLHCVWIVEHYFNSFFYFIVNQMIPFFQVTAAQWRHHEVKLTVCWKELLRDWVEIKNPEKHIKAGQCACAMGRHYKAEKGLASVFLLPSSSCGNLMFN